MSIRVDVDVAGAKELGADLEAVPAEALPKFARVVGRGANNIKNQLRDEAKESGHYKHFHRSISYDLVSDLEAEIGPDKSRIQGALGNILYFGTSKNAPVLDLEAPLRRETPRFELALADVAEDVLS